MGRLRRLSLLFVARVSAARPAGKFADAEKNESTSFLPGDAESTKALEAVTEELQGGEQAPIVIVYRREGGLTAADRKRGSADDRRARPSTQDRPSTRCRRQAGVLRDGDAALFAHPITRDGEGERSSDPVDDIRERVSDPAAGSRSRSPAPPGFAADAIKVFEDINGTLLCAAALLVFIAADPHLPQPDLLVDPALRRGLSPRSTRAVVGYGLTEVGVTVNGQSSSILSVLVLGAGTDYALLLVSRYREELRRHEDKHEAMALALRTAGPGDRRLGPDGDPGAAVPDAGRGQRHRRPRPDRRARHRRRDDHDADAAAGAAGDLRPAGVLRRSSHTIPHFGDAGADETHGIWRRVGERVAGARGGSGSPASRCSSCCSLGVAQTSTPA